MKDMIQQAEFQWQKQKHHPPHHQHHTRHHRQHPRHYHPHPQLSPLTPPPSQPPPPTAGCIKHFVNNNNNTNNATRALYSSPYHNRRLHLRPYPTTPPPTINTHPRPRSMSEFSSATLSTSFPPTPNTPSQGNKSPYWMSSSSSSVVSSPNSNTPKPTHSFSKISKTNISPPHISTPGRLVFNFKKEEAFRRHNSLDTKPTYLTTTVNKHCSCCLPSKPS